MNFLPGNRFKQQGAVLLVLFFTLFAASATLFLSSVNTHTVEIRRHKDVRTELLKAKQALIAYAVNYHTFGFDNVDDMFVMDEGPGRLICPDVDNDGLSDTDSTDCTDYVRGRFPQRFSYGGNTVILNDAFAAIDQQFWYVVSPAFKEIATSNVNHLTTGDLTIDGESGYVAVIIAPGEALAGQDRSISQTAATNYLEQDNLAGTSFINSYPTDPDTFNDQVIGIKESELMLAMLRGTEGNPKVATDPAKQAIYDYYQDNGNLPVDQSTLSIYGKNQGYGWFFDEDYVSSTLTEYVRNTTYQYVKFELEGCATREYYVLPTFSPFPAFFEFGSTC